MVYFLQISIFFRKTIIRTQNIIKHIQIFLNFMVNIPSNDIKCNLWNIIDGYVSGLCK